MPTAFVKYRSGGGYQKVNEYDYVFDARKLWESGYYRDSGFQPTITPADGSTLDAIDDLEAVSFGNGGTTGGGYGTFSNLNCTIGATWVPKSYVPDEISHTDLRQSAWYETSLTFCTDSSTSEIFTTSNSGGLLRIVVADSSLYAGRPIRLSGDSSLGPQGVYFNQIYYAIATGPTYLTLQSSYGGAQITSSANGDGVISVVNIVAEFPWANILGWSDTAPTR